MARPGLARVIPTIPGINQIIVYIFDFFGVNRRPDIRMYSYYARPGCVQRGPLARGGRPVRPAVAAEPVHALRAPSRMCAQASRAAGCHRPTPLTAAQVTARSDRRCRRWATTSPSAAWCWKTDSWLHGRDQVTCLATCQAVCPAVPDPTMAAAS